MALVLFSLFLFTCLSHAWDRDTLLLYGQFVEDVYNKVNKNSMSPNSNSTDSLQAAASDYKITRTLFATEKVGPFFGEPNVSIGYVAISESRKNIVVVLRGTSDPAEWAKNLLDDQVPFTYLDRSSCGCRVHDGFLNLYTASDATDMSLRDQIVQELGKLTASNSGYSIVMTGHSLGGALAILSAFDISNSDLGRKSGVSVYTFAAPMVGDERFKSLADGLGALSILRVWDVRDVIPYLPSLNFQHAGKDLPVDGCQLDTGGGSFISKLSLYHSLKRYLRTISSLSGSSLGERLLEEDIEGDVEEFVKSIISSVKSELGGLVNLVAAMKSYVSSFTKSCSKAR